MATVKRKGISKKIRFEVFKRDSFKCQYCGATAPDVILVIDHINPVKGGGKNNIENLITACNSCNAGKGARLLDDNTVVEKQRQQLEELNERRQQLEMMMEWREGLVKLNDDIVARVVDYFEDMASCDVCESGIGEIKKVIKKHPLQLVLESIDDSCTQYLEGDCDGLYTEESQDKALSYIAKICNMKMVEKEKPYMKDLFYVRGILRNRFQDCDSRMALIYLERAYISGFPIEFLNKLALQANNWAWWKNEIERCLEANE